MVKISEIIRKPERERPKRKPGIISEVIKIKKEEESFPGIKKIYEEAIHKLKRLMNDIKDGKNVEGKNVAALAEKIIESLRINKNILISFVNNSALHESNEDYLYQHSLNASILATNLGSARGYSKDKLLDLCGSTLLHDIGILKVPREIITKPSILTKEENDQIKKHPAHGLELLENIKNPPESAAAVIYEHHERIDGTGYPEGKTGEEISEYAKIVAIVEVYEAITHPRPYHRNIPYEGARMIVQEAKSSFEPEFVKLFLNYITPYPPGSLILLNNDEVGRVVHINEGLPLRPIVEIIYDSEGRPAEKPKRIDLSKSPVLNIKRAVDESSL
ncbi:MAG: HD domain-containing protein [Candidatus Aminicenantes bacterium]|nr:HD domain-containing protein [Candidatus Aminicenantes bacterium]